MTANLHPTSLPIDALLDQCEVSRTRRSGPGGQHRNKVETAIVIVHKPTGVRAEASEQRSQARNQSVAISRLRLQLAIEVRSEAVREEPSELWQSRCRGGRIQVSDQHDEFATLIAEALDVFVSNELDHKATAAVLECSVSQLTKLLARSTQVFQSVNQQRAAVGLHRLRT